MSQYSKLREIEVRQIKKFESVEDAHFLYGQARGTGGELFFTAAAIFGTTDDRAKIYLS